MHNLHCISMVNILNHKTSCIFTVWQQCGRLQPILSQLSKPTAVTSCQSRELFLINKKNESKKEDKNLMWVSSIFQQIEDACSVSLEPKVQAYVYDMRKRKRRIRIQLEFSYLYIQIVCVLKLYSFFDQVLFLCLSFFSSILLNSYMMMIGQVMKSLFLLDLTRNRINFSRNKLLLSQLKHVKISLLP